MTNTNEEQRLGATYLLSFSEAVNELTNASIQYSTLLDRYDQRSKHGVADLNDVNTVAEQARTTKYWVHRTYIQYRSIAQTSDNIDTSKATLTYNKLYEQNILSKNEVLEYTQSINDALSSQIIQTLLQTSSHILNDIYPTQ